MDKDEAVQEFVRGVYLDDRSIYDSDATGKFDRAELLCRILNAYISECSHSGKLVRRRDGNNG